tara:strand:- start:410 stop:1744 length:1335 start_codon:yes stop_codon:yes gene_type:complete
MKMKYTLAVLLFLFVFTNAEEIIDSCGTDIITDIDSTNQYLKIENQNIKQENTYKKKLFLLDQKTPMDLQYNEKVKPFIENYLGVNVKLIERMLVLQELYFPLFEQTLDKYGLPMELKYLSIVESALNPKAKSSSGATGLWQFMYLTGKQYDLRVTSYMDERQDPYKSTEAACKYFVKLYEMFGDWNLVLAAYNGGPGYLQRKINSVGTYSFWDLYPHLRRETRNYIPTFIAVNYVMNFYDNHNILPAKNSVNVLSVDTLNIKKQVDVATLSKILCVNKETINYLNPAYKNDIFPKNAILILPDFAVVDFLDNAEANYFFIEAVDNKEILINEERIVYQVERGDYLGKIAINYGVQVFELKKWNNLRSTKLNIGQELVLYVKEDLDNNKKNVSESKNEYVVQKGDTLWEIAKKNNGVSIWKIKSLNNLETDKLIPGTKILLPKG